MRKEELRSVIFYLMKNKEVESKHIDSLKFIEKLLTEKLENIDKESYEAHWCNMSIDFLEKVINSSEDINTFIKEQPELFQNMISFLVNIVDENINLQKIFEKRLSLVESFINTYIHSETIKNRLNSKVKNIENKFEINLELDEEAALKNTEELNELISTLNLLREEEQIQEIEDISADIEFIQNTFLTLKNEVYQKGLKKIN